MPKCPFHNNHMDGAMNFTIRDEVILCLFRLDLSELALHMSMWCIFLELAVLVAMLSVGHRCCWVSCEYLQLFHAGGELLAEQCGEERGDAAAQVREDLLQL